MYAKIKNGQVIQFPYTWTAFVADNNNTNYADNTDMLSIFPDTDLAKQGFECVAVDMTDPPSIDERTQTYSEGPIALVNGVWTQTWITSQKSADQLQSDADQQASSVREQRNNKLKESDWTQLADSTADKQAWATYRQALRDITTQAGFPWTITWPDAP